MYYYYRKRFLHDSLETIPEGAIPLTDKEHSELFAAFEQGYELSEDASGRPIAVPQHTHSPDLLRIDEIKNRLSAIDAKSTRAVRAILSGTATDADRSYLGTLEAQAQALRVELKQIEK
jgi:hypothetical protein